MFSSINTFLNLFSMIGIGFILAKKNLLNDETNKTFSYIIVNISLPSLMISNITTRFNQHELFKSSTGLLYCFSGVLISYLISVLIANILKISRNKKGIFCAMFTFSNSIFIGLPVNLSLYGQESILYVLIYYLANTTLFWTIGVYKIKTSKDIFKDNYKLKLLRKLISPPLIGFLVGILVVITKINIPIFLLDTFKYLGNLTTPLSMIFIGAIISSIKISNVKLDLESYLILFGKFIVTPIVFFILLKFTGFPDIMKKVFIMEAAMPVLTQAAIVSKFYDVESDYTTIIVTLTTLISFIYLPVLSIVLNFLSV